MKILITNFELQWEDGVQYGCNNGNYVGWKGIIAVTGKEISGLTCNCLCGCSETDRLEVIDYNEKTVYLLR